MSELSMTEELSHFLEAEEDDLVNKACHSSIEFIEVDGEDHNVIFVGDVGPIGELFHNSVFLNFCKDKDHCYIHGGFTMVCQVADGMRTYYLQNGAPVYGGIKEDDLHDFMSAFQAMLDDTGHEAVVVRDDFILFNYITNTFQILY